MQHNLPRVDELTAAILRLADQLCVVDSETLPIAKAAGRVLAEPLLADRDSPPCDVSAMDGYAIQLADFPLQSLPVIHTAVAGAPPAQLQPGTAIKIFTGAPVPLGADTIIVREQTQEADGRVTIQTSRDGIQMGQHIRRRGENIAAGASVLAAGCEVDPVVMAAVATFGKPMLRVSRHVRVAVVNTGDELLPSGEPAEAWQIRDSNGPLLENWLSRLPWIQLVSRTRVPDDFDTIRQHLAAKLEQCDALIVTGGMSAGDTDHVPSAVSALGGTTIFHRLGIRPGKPVFGAHWHQKLIVGLPGNPVSVAVTARILAQPLLQHLAGKCSQPPTPLVELVEPSHKPLPLIWFRLVEVSADGQVSLIDNRGSGDLVALARSAGFVTIPAGATGRGPWPFTAW